MRRIRVGLIAAVVALGAASWSAAPAAAGTAAPAVSYYLSLGDSLAQGVQPEPEPNGPNTPTKQGYPDQLYPTLRAANPTLQLQKVGCPGETTTTMLHGGGPCAAAYTTGSQLEDAVQFLQAHHGHIADLTINIGSNDILSCVQPDGSIDTACTLGEIQTARSNLNTILATLHPYLDGRGVKAAGMTYYDPLLAAWTASHQLAAQSVILTDLLNAAEAVSYLHHGFRVAPVAAAFQTNNFSIAPRSSVPVNVAQICQFTWMCTSTPPNIHPNAHGYQLIATTFANTLD